MKHFFFIFSLLFFISCQDRLPIIENTNIDNFVNNKTVYFPKNTEIKDIINVLQFLSFSNNKKIFLNGFIEITDTTTLNDFYTYTNTQKRQLSSIYIEYNFNKELKSYLYTIYFYLNYNNVESLDFNFLENKNTTTKKIKNLIYKYEYQNNLYNVWQNEKIPFDCTIYLD